MAFVTCEFYKNHGGSNEVNKHDMNDLQTRRCFAHENHYWTWLQTPSFWECQDFEGSYVSRPWMLNNRHVWWACLAAAVQVQLHVPRSHWSSPSLTSGQRPDLEEDELLAEICLHNLESCLVWLHHLCLQSCELVCHWGLPEVKYM